MPRRKSFKYDADRAGLLANLNAYGVNTKDLTAMAPDATNDQLRDLHKGIMRVRGIKPL